MKKAIVLFCATLLIGTSVSATEITRSFEKKVLKVIDQVCGDSWCESDYNFTFRNLVCDSKSFECVVSFEYQLQGESVTTIKEDTFELTMTQPVGLGSCRLNNIKGKSDLLSSDSDRALAPGFENNLGACLNQITR